MINEIFALPVLETSQVGEARRLANEMGRNLGLTETEAGKVALIVVEAATNLVKHAGGGELVLRSLQEASQVGIEILALDKGPGIADIDACLRDGYSTAGSPGTGLGAITRAATGWDIHSMSGKGTALMAQFWSPSTRKKSGPEGLRIGVISVPKAGETVCGDSWHALVGEHQSRIFVADGLGHGPSAAEAALAARNVFHENPAMTPMALMEAMHAALRGTRGGAAAVAEIDAAKGVVHFAGIGNISGVIVSDENPRHMVSHNGTLGYAARKFQEFVYPWPKNALLILHSDGLGTHWDLHRYDGLIGRHPSLIAGVLYRDFTRKRDDVTVLVAGGLQA